MNFYFAIFFSFLKKNYLLLLIMLLNFSIVGLNIYSIFFQVEDSPVTPQVLLQDQMQEVIEEKEDTPKDTSLETYYIDIKGSIKKPGVYEMDANSIVNDCIKKAGGLLNNADTTTINLSKKVSAEMVIYIPKKAEVVKSTTNTTVTKDTSIQNNAAIDMEDKTPSTPKNEDTSALSTKVNINTAPIEELTKLSGIGESKAQSIISYRNQHGNFKTIEEIKNISGIGDSLFEKIKDNITV